MTALNASRYTIFVPLARGRTLAYNGMNGGLALWEDHERDIYQRGPRRWTEEIQRWRGHQAPATEGEEHGQGEQRT